MSTHGCVESYVQLAATLFQLHLLYSFLIHDDSFVTDPLSCNHPLCSARIIETIFVGLFPCTGSTKKESLTLNLQDFTYIPANGITKIGINYGGSCEVKVNFGLKLNEPSSSSTLNGSSILLSSEYHSDENHVPKTFRLIAEDENGKICSDEQSQLTYYQIERPGMLALKPELDTNFGHWYSKYTTQS